MTDGFENAREFCRVVVEEASVVLAPGDVFGFPDHFRIGFGLPTDHLLTGLERVADCIERHARHWFDPDSDSDSDPRPRPGSTVPTTFSPA